MKSARIPLLIVLVGLFMGPGCGSIDVAPGGKPDRVLTGTVSAGVALPAGTDVVVRLVATPGPPETVRTVGADAPVLTRPTSPAAERVLGEHAQTLTAGTMEPVAFRIEYSADDAAMRRGLNLDVRVSSGGKLRFRTVNAHVVTLASSAYRQDVAVQAVER